MAAVACARHRCCTACASVRRGAAGGMQDESKDRAGAGSRLDGVGRGAVAGTIARGGANRLGAGACCRSEEHTSELQSLMRISYAVFCLKKKKQTQTHAHHIDDTQPTLRKR